MLVTRSMSSLIFLSTPSARRASSGKTAAAFAISIHALREEGDTTLHLLRQGVNHFYPRPPRGGRQGIA